VRATAWLTRGRHSLRGARRGASGFEATRYEFLSLFFRIRPVLFLAVRALADSGFYRWPQVCIKGSP